MKSKAAAVVAAVLVLAGCASSGGSGGGGPAVISNPRWMAGDSLVAYVQPHLSVPTFYAGQGGNGFVYANAGTIESFTVSLLAGINHPAVVLVTGGLNDAAPARGISVTDTILAMEHFEATMTAVGARTVWITEPVYPAFQPAALVSAMAVTNGWMLTRSFHADCGLAATSVLNAGTVDGVHPNGPSTVAFASCIDAAG